MFPGKRFAHDHGSACFHEGENNPEWVMYIFSFIALIASSTPKNDLLKAEVKAFDSSCFEKKIEIIQNGYLIPPGCSHMRYLVGGTINPYSLSMSPAADLTAAGSN